MHLPQLPCWMETQQGENVLRIESHSLKSSRRRRDLANFTRFSKQVRMIPQTRSLVPRDDCIVWITFICMNSMKWFSMLWFVSHELFDYNSKNINSKDSSKATKLLKASDLPRDTEDTRHTRSLVPLVPSFLSG